MFLSSFLYGEETTKDHAITIFVHGTTPLRPFLELLPCKSLLYCKQGLHLAKDLPQHYHFHKLAAACIEQDQEHFSWDQFYMFGWQSEKIYHHVRRKTAQLLQKQLEEKVQAYWRQHHIVPKIRLLGFSHGGNVIINLADFLPIACAQKVVEIEAWLFGTPVQVVNRDLVNSQYFTNIYSVFSQNDWIQRLDPQGLRNIKLLKQNYFWSDRAFGLESRCKQVKFTVNGKSIGHMAYRGTCKHFVTIKNLVEKEFSDQQQNCIEVDLKI